MRSQLDICERHGISHSHYLGGPQLWTDLDREKVEAYKLWKSEACQKCGTHPDWWDPAKGGDRNAFIATDRRCPGCEVFEELHDQVHKGGRARGVQVHLIPNPRLRPGYREEDDDD